MRKFKKEKGCKIRKDRKLGIRKGFSQEVDLPDTVLTPNS